MYTLPPAGPLLPVVAAGAAAGLPATGAPTLPVVVLGTAAVVLLLGGSALVARSSSVGGSPVLRASAVLLVLCYLVPVLAGGGISTGWDVVGLLVGVFTLSYAALALRNLLPGPVRR